MVDMTMETTWQRLKRRSAGERQPHLPTLVHTRRRTHVRAYTRPPKHLHPGTHTCARTGTLPPRAHGSAHTQTADARKRHPGAQLCAYTANPVHVLQGPKRRARGVPDPMSPRPGAGTPLFYPPLLGLPLAGFHLPSGQTVTLTWGGSREWAPGEAAGTWL